VLLVSPRAAFLASSSACSLGLKLQVPSGFVDLQCYASYLTKPPQLQLLAASLAVNDTVLLCMKVLC
jgi:hypothetical protein